jgi:RimJ/RimL family protein N-acetyltransferase/ketosteroid isomerase-like protein
MKSPPERIDGVLVRLRRATPEDAPALFLAAASPEVMKYMTWPAQASDSETRNHLEGAVQRWVDGTEYQWIIEERSTGELAGTISYRPKAHSADFGYFLARSHWRKGLAHEAGMLVLNWLKAQPEILRVWATTDAENTRSHKVLEHLGLQQEGVLRMATHRPNIGGPPRDTTVYAWCRNDAVPLGSCQAPSTPEQALACYEAALAARNLEAIERLIDNEACFLFSEGTYLGRKAIGAAIAHTFATINDETYRISDVQWIHRSPDAALCTYQFNWSGMIDDQFCAGEGRGTCLLTLSSCGWQIKHEHLGPKEE